MAYFFLFLIFVLDETTTFILSKITYYEYSFNKSKRVISNIFN